MCIFCLFIRPVTVPQAQTFPSGFWKGVDWRLLDNDHININCKSKIIVFFCSFFCWNLVQISFWKFKIFWIFMDFFGGKRLNFSFGSLDILTLDMYLKYCNLGDSSEKSDIFNIKTKLFPSWIQCSLFLLYKILVFLPRHEKTQLSYTNTVFAKIILPKKTTKIAIWIKKYIYDLTQSNHHKVV